MARKILWALLALAPITIFIEYVAHPGDVVLFVLSAVALIPLAWLIGEATEHAAHHTGPGIGGFLNATFGNAPELIIALFALSATRALVALYGLSGETEKAARAKFELLRLEPDSSIGTIKVARAYFDGKSATFLAQREQTYYRGLKIAGLPD